MRKINFKPSVLVLLVAVLLSSCAGLNKMKKDEEGVVKRKLIEMVRENLRIRPVVQMMEPGSLPRFEVKAKRVVDKRIDK